MSIKAVKLIYAYITQGWIWFFLISINTSKRANENELSLWKKKRKGKNAYLNGSESCPLLGLVLGLFARGQPDKLRCDE